MRQWLLLALLIGCNSSPGNTTDASIAGDAIDADAASAADAPPQASCAAGKLCLRVNPVAAGATIPDGRLVVVFYQMIEHVMPPVPELVGLDRPFTAATPTIEIPLADIVLPAPIDDYRLCPRTCLALDNPACDCPAAHPKIALAFVFVMRDLDASGAIEPAELVDENLYGVGVLQLGAADRAYAAPNALDPLLPDGILDGLAPYRIIPTTDFDDLGIAAPGTVFDLDVCVPGDASCDMIRFPNLT
jgi:hypothetical protein